MGGGGGAVMAAACTVIGEGAIQSVSGWLMGGIVVSHLFGRVVLGAMGGQDGSGLLVGCGVVLVLSASRPREKRS